ncbi:MAG: NifB/NifX family molybdenum-iron cluster-binding protein [Anaerolineae bacterium]|jgi:predicted Fe-Mo cluster-binding NifX family protein
MKIACVTDDGQTISAHFGRAAYYAVITVEDGQIVSRELRDKMGHTHFVSRDATAGAAEHSSIAGHGMGRASHDKHVTMAETISDCEVLLCRGMGRGAYLSMQQIGIKPMVTDVVGIEDAVKTYVAGGLIDHTEALH